MIKKNFVLAILTFSLLLSGYSFYEVKTSSNLLISENVEALSCPGLFLEGIEFIGYDFDYVEYYQIDPSCKGTLRYFGDTSVSPYNWVDRNLYVDIYGHIARKCHLTLKPTFPVVYGHCFDLK